MQFESLFNHQSRKNHHQIASLLKTNSSMLWKWSIWNLHIPSMLQVAHLMVWCEKMINLRKPPTNFTQIMIRRRCRPTGFIQPGDCQQGHHLLGGLGLLVQRVATSGGKGRTYWLLQVETKLHYYSRTKWHRLLSLGSIRAGSLVGTGRVVKREAAFADDHKSQHPPFHSCRRASGSLCKELSLLRLSC